MGVELRMTGIVWVVVGNEVERPGLCCGLYCMWSKEHTEVQGEGENGEVGCYPHACNVPYFPSWLSSWTAGP